MIHFTLRKTDMFIGLICLTLFLPILYLHGVRVIDNDVALLYAMAERLVNGESMILSIWDTNPPLSVLFYAPATFIKNNLNLPAYLSVSIYIFSILSFLLLLVYALLFSVKFSDRHHPLLIFYSFIFANILMPFIEFGERDQFIMCGLMILTLVQIHILHKSDVSKPILYSAAFVASILILMKPHHGLIPALMICYRLIKERQIRTLINADFIALSVTTATYIACTLIFFPGYISDILPAAIELYSGIINPAIYKTILIVSAVICACWGGTYLLKIEEEPKLIIFSAGFAGFLSLISFYTLGQGFYYHLLPTLLFVTIMLACFGYELIKTVFKPQFAVYGVIFFSYAIALVMFYEGLMKLPTHSQFKQMVLAQKLQEHCPQPDCTFLFNGETNWPAFQLKMYSDAEFGSRFTSHWFLPKIATDMALKHQNMDGLMTDERQKQYLQTFAALIHKDFGRYKPDVLFLQREEPHGGIDINFWNFYSYYMPLTAEKNNYELTETFTYDRGQYFQGTSFGNETIHTIDVFTRRSPENERQTSDILNNSIEE